MALAGKIGEPDHYLFVIDTDSYAGSFEREMCAYVTGQYGECEVGKETAESVIREGPNFFGRLEDLVKHVPDEHGCHRPASIFPTPGWFNHGMGGHFRDGQEKEALVDYKKRTREYFKKTPLAYVESAREKVSRESQQKIDEAEALTEVSKYPAYMSVAIYLNEIPEKDLLEVMKKRALDIAQKGVGLKGFEHKVNVTGFRLLEQYTTFKELEI